MRDTLRPGLRAHLDYMVGADRTVPALLCAFASDGAMSCSATPSTSERGLAILGR